jgi:hypothetical protein
MHIHTDARTRQMYVHMSYTRAVGVSKTVIKGDGNSLAVGSKRRDREDVVCRRPVRPNTCQKKPEKKVIATFRIPEVAKEDFCVKKCGGTCREDRTTHRLRTSRPHKESVQHTSSLA